MNFRELVMNRQTVIVMAFAVALLLANALLLNTLSDTEDKLASLEVTRKEILDLRAEYLDLKGKIDSIEGKKHLTGIKGIVHAVDEIFEPLGLKEKVKSVKPLAIGSRDRDIREETAEVIVQGVTMNEMVNIFYTIENAPMLLLTRKVNIRQSFESPEMLNITMTISFIKP